MAILDQNCEISLSEEKGIRRYNVEKDGMGDHVRSWRSHLYQSADGEVHGLDAFVEANHGCI